MSNLVISTNVAGINSHRSLKLVSNRAEKASEKLSSGYKINRAADDAAGLAISEKMRNQIKGLNMASKNAADGISLIQTAEGALQETNDMLKRMRELVVQGANDTNVSSDREKIGLELNQLCCEINSTAAKTEYNKKRLISGDCASSKGGIYLKVGANTNQGIVVAIEAMSCSVIGLSASKFVPSAVRNLTQGSGWDVLLSQIDKGVSSISTQRAKLGAYQNRLDYTVRNLDTAAENLSSAESRIRDTDMALSMMEFTKSNVLSQAGMSMLTQANQAPNQVLSLLRN